jgi:tRNA-(ms[2]io[6]A)-hydroxylase
MVPADPTLPTLASEPLPFCTPPAWAQRLVPHVDELLVEQAHLEKKAAAAAMSFLFRVPVAPDVLRGLSALAREELVHFERTLKLLAARGVPFTSQPPSAYAERLKAGVARTMPQRLVDELLVGAIIEARSCERMRLFAAALRGVHADVADFYEDLVAAEERHAVLYAEVASQLVPPADVARRWRELGRHEAEVLNALPWSPRLHGGLPVEVSPGC